MRRPNGGVMADEQHNVPEKPLFVEKRCGTDRRRARSEALPWAGKERRKRSRRQTRIKEIGFEIWAAHAARFRQRSVS